MITVQTERQIHNTACNNNFSTLRNVVSRCTHLVEYGLLVALGSEEAGKALTNTSIVIAGTAARAVPSVKSGIASHNIYWIRRALSERAVRSTETNITDASLGLYSIPSSTVYLSSLRSKVLLGSADSTSTAIIRAHTALTAITSVSREAVTFTSLAVTDSHVSALSRAVATVSSIRGTSPRVAERACAQRAVSTRPEVGEGSSVVVLLLVAGALVVSSAGAVAGAEVRARGLYGGDDERRGEDNAVGHDDDCESSPTIEL